MATAAERKAARAALTRTNAAAEVREENAASAARTSGKDEATPSTTKRSRDTVTVCCKVPNGVIMQNHVLEDGFEPVFGGGSRPIKISRPVGDPITLIGSSRAPGSDPDAKRVVGGYGMTFNVPKEDFEKWMRDNAAMDMIKNKLIFAADDADRASDQARDQKAFRSGLEGLNVEGRKASGDYIDPRMPKNVKKYKPEDESTDIRGH
jgi:hypothetical protein